MKKVIYIVFAVFALGLASCAKQDIKPTSSSDTAVPVWKSLDTDVTDPGSTNNEGGGGITDPNENEEISNVGT